MDTNERLKPVSYTHLDVYKRQLLFNAFGTEFTATIEFPLSIVRILHAYNLRGLFNYHPFQRIRQGLIPD